MSLPKTLIFFAGLFNFLGAFAPDQNLSQNIKSTTMKLMFAGDIMGHRSQIASAYNYKTKSYNYDFVFEKVASLFAKADFAIANLELTFGGRPYGGFPQFSSPDSLADAIKKANINTLVTANNHSADRGCRGIRRTISILDKRGILHTGTFASQKEKEQKNLLVLKKDSLKVGLLNYTQDTNGIYVSRPCIVNIINKSRLKEDIKNAKDRVDKLIVFLHWGEQYRHYPTKKQRALADFLIKNGVDLVIGSHPHVIEPIIYKDKTDGLKSSIIVYSLGNFISNQQRTGRDGGVVLEVDITKSGDLTKISGSKYYLTWVHKFYSRRGKRKYQIIPYFKRYFSRDKRYYYKMRDFIRNSKRVLKNSKIKLATTQIDLRERERFFALNYFKREVKDDLVIP